MIGSVCNFSGPVLGGYAIEHFGPELTFMFLAASPLACMMMLALGGSVLPRGSAAPASGPGLLATLADREVLRLLSVSALVQLSLDLFPPYIPIYGRGIGLAPSAIGNIVGTIFVCAFLVQLVLARVVRGVGEHNVLSGAFVAAMCGFLLLPLTAGAVSLGLLACLFWVAMGCAHPVTSMLLSSRAPRGRPAETLGFRLSINNVLRAVGPTALGSLGTALGLVPMFIVTALMMASGAWLSRRLPFRS